MKGVYPMNQIDYYVSEKNSQGEDVITRYSLEFDLEKLKELNQEIILNCSRLSNKPVLQYKDTKSGGLLITKTGTHIVAKSPILSYYIDRFIECYLNMISQGKTTLNPIILDDLFGYTKEPTPVAEIKDMLNKLNKKYEDSLFYGKFINTKEYINTYNHLKDDLKLNEQQKSTYSYYLNLLQLFIITKKETIVPHSLTEGHSFLPSTHPEYLKKIKKMTNIEK